MQDQPNAMDAARMHRAIELSREHMLAGDGGPFGAIVTLGDQIVAEGFNQVTSTFDPTAHAEVVAIRGACKALQRFHLNDCVLYTSCEPCPMCLAAAYWAQIPKIYFANTRDDAESIGFSDALLYREIPLPMAERSIEFIELGRPEALEVFRQWHAKVDKIPY